MKSGTRTLHWNTPMIFTQRAHASPTKGDGETFLRHVSHAALGRDMIRAVDCNFQLVRNRAGKWIAVMCHWATNMGRNGYTRIVDARSGRVRNMTRAERIRPLSQWKWEDLRRCRRRNGDQPLSYGQAVSLAARLGVVIVAELKATGFSSVQKMREMVAAARKVDHPAWFMALYGSMRGCKQKAMATVTAGGWFQVIFGRFFSRFGRTQPRDWATWGHHPRIRVSPPAKWSHA